MNADNTIINMEDCILNNQDQKEIEPQFYLQKADIIASLILVPSHFATDGHARKKGLNEVNNNKTVFIIMLARSHLCP